MSANSRLDINIRKKDFVGRDGSILSTIRDLKFSLAENSFTCLVGPSGCGKTTALRIILGLDTHYNGEISLAKESKISAVFQEPQLLPWRTVEQNVRLPLSNEQIDRPLTELFSILGLDEFRGYYPNQLSLGLARRVSMARALAIEPDLLILDEPFASLDEATSDRLQHYLLSASSTRPMTTLMVTHSLKEAVRLADRILFLSDRPTSINSEFQVDTARDDRDALFLTTTVAKLRVEHTYQGEP